MTAFYNKYKNKIECSYFLTIFLRHSKIEFYTKSRMKLNQRSTFWDTPLKKSHYVGEYQVLNISNCTCKRFWYSHTKWEFFNGYDSKSRNIIQSCGRISIGIEKNRIRFYLNDDIFSQFLFVYFTLDCHYFVKKY